LRARREIVVVDSPIFYGEVKSKCPILTPPSRFAKQHCFTQGTSLAGGNAAGVVSHSFFPRMSAVLSMPCGTHSSSNLKQRREVAQ
jgi:hypothetical protein